jgi:hypothetical protein
LGEGEGEGDRTTLLATLAGSGFGLTLYIARGAATGQRIFFRPQVVRCE